MIDQEDDIQQQNPIKTQKMTITQLINTIQFTKFKPKKKALSQTDSISSTHSLENNKQKSKIWSQEEQQKFILMLNKFGTDFSILSKFFPRKTKNQIKNKYKQKCIRDKKIAKEQDSKLKALMNMKKIIDDQKSDKEKGVSI